MNEGFLLFEQDKCAETVGRLLFESLPQPWTEVEIDVKFIGDSVDIGNVYKMPDSDERRYPGYIYGIDVAFMQYAKAAAAAGESHRPTSAHYRLTPDGKYDLIFGYGEEWD